MRESFFLIDYQKYLETQKISTSTVDNYLVDAIKFLKWLTSYLTKLEFTISPDQPTTFISYTDHEAVIGYRKHLISRESSPATISRRISGLKKLLDFAVSAGYLPENPAQSLKNVASFDPKKTLSEFKKWLEKEEVTDTTVKNYLADVRHFLEFVKS